MIGHDNNKLFHLISLLRLFPLGLAFKLLKLENPDGFLAGLNVVASDFRLSRFAGALALPCLSCAPLVIGSENRSTEVFAVC